MKRFEVSRKKTDVVALDWDMTCVDSHGKLLQNLAIAHEFGNIIDEDEVRRHWNESTGFPDLMARLTNNADFDEIMKVVKRDYAKIEYAKKSFAFTKSALQMLREEGLKLAIVSGVQGELLRLDASDLGVDLGMFDYIQAQEDCEFKKPDGRVFNPLLTHFGITANRLLYIGDEMKDYRAAKEAGASFVGVLTGMTSKEEFEAVGATYVKDLGRVHGKL